MPSYRLLVDILDVRPGHASEAVEERLVAAVEANAFVESHDLGIVSGVPRLRVRFLVPEVSPAADNATAWEIGQAAYAAVQEVALAQNPRVLRRTPRGRWMAVTPAWGR